MAKKKIRVTNKNGQEFEVTQKAFDVVYKGLGYKRVEEADAHEFQGNENIDEPTDLYTLSREELEKVNKADITAFLNEEGIEFDEKAKKEELIDLIAGE